MTYAYVVAAVAGQRVALDATAVEAIVAVGSVTRIPRAPPHVAGLCAVRSHVMTVIDVALAAGARHDAPAGDHAALVLHDGHRYALRLDRVADVELIGATPCANDASIGRDWLAIAPTRIETAGGFALLLDIGQVVAGANGRC